MKRSDLKKMIGEELEKFDEAISRSPMTGVKSEGDDLFVELYYAFEEAVASMLNWANSIDKISDRESTKIEKTISYNAKEFSKENKKLYEKAKKHQFKLKKK